MNFAGVRSRSWSLHLAVRLANGARLSRQLVDTPAVAGDGVGRARTRGLAENGVLLRQPQCLGRPKLAVPLSTLQSMNDSEGSALWQL